MKAGAKGFTLIELVVVITIIGILAAVAAPRFINVQSDARASVISGLEGSIRSAASLVYAKALIAGVESSATGSITIGSTTINTAYGYPTNASLIDAIEFSGQNIYEDAAAPGSFGYDSDGDSAFTVGTDNACQVVYNNAIAAAGDSPSIVATTTGC